MTDTYDQLRSLAATNPKAARALLEVIASGTESTLDTVLTLASRPGESRVRQAVAVFHRSSTSDQRIEPFLREWQSTETDEFTKRAIESALRQDIPEARPRQAARQLPTTEAYRYYASRLCHQVRNALAQPDSQLRRLELLAQSLPDTQLREQLTDIWVGVRNGFHRVARSVEFDLGDDYLAWTSIRPCEWVAARSPELAARFGVAKLILSGTPQAQRCSIRTTPFLLDTLFGNIWMNAIQVAEGSECLLEIQAATDIARGILSLTFIDSGPGFPEVLLDTAFVQSFSTRGPSRGRGLLEVDDAVNRMGGSAALVEVRPKELRIRLEFPMDGV